MARCAGESCGRWCPDLLVRRGTGASIDGRWYCSRACVERMARQWLIDARPVVAAIPTVPPARLGAILRHHGVCGATQIEQALDAQRESGMKLGEQLLVLGFTERHALLRALAAQAGVSYLRAVEASLVRRAPGGLSPQAVRALGLVPISDPEGKRIRVACPAPVPRRAIGSFRQLTGWIPEVYLVSDADWDTLVTNYGIDVQEGTFSRPLADFVQTENLLDAAAGIALAATSDRNTSVKEARWDPYTWVRVQGEERTTDIVFSHLTSQEVACQADTTSH